MERNEEIVEEVKREQDRGIYEIEIEYSETGRVNKDQALQAAVEFLEMYVQSHNDAGMVEEDVIVDELYRDLEELLELRKCREIYAFKPNWEGKMDSFFDKYEVRFAADAQF